MDIRYVFSILAILLFIFYFQLNYNIHKHLFANNTQQI